MTRTSFLQSAFALLLLAVLLPAIIRVWSIRALFFDAPLRANVQAELQAMAKEHGWNLSSLEVVQADAFSMTVHVREYRRGNDPKECLKVDFLLHTIAPCASN